MNEPEVLTNEEFPLLHDPPGRDEVVPWWFRIPFFGWTAAYLWQIELETRLVNQVVERGPVPESAWAPYTYSEPIRRRIEEIVIECAYPEGSTFHPLDPVELMFVLRYGDLNEAEILMSIENQLGFKADDALVARLINERTTFVEFIQMVENSNAE